MADGIVLGIHSKVVDGGFTGGHAWLSVTEGGKTTYYGLWPDAHPRTPDNGDATDIRIGMERNSKAKASRYYSLSPAQAQRFRAQTKSNVQWFYTNNCSSWASEVVLEVTGEDVDADDWLGIETPRELGQNILKLEERDPTSLMTPKKLRNDPATSIATSGRGTFTSSRKTSIGGSW